MSKKSIKLTTRQTFVLILMGVGTFLLLTGIEYFLFQPMIDADFQFFFDYELDLTACLEIWAKWIFLLIVNLATASLQVRRQYKKYEVRYVTNAVHESIDGSMKQLDIKVNKNLQTTVSAINLLITNTTKLVEDERELENSKDELITNVSHDIRTPLTSIIGYLGLIENSQNLGKEEIAKYTHIAYLKSQQMQVLVNDLFDYTNAQHSDAVLNISEFDMGQLMEQFAAEYELEAKKRNIEIISQTDPQVFKMKADTDKLGRVFNNLISNAFKYGKGAKYIWLEAVKNNEYAVIRISNDGKKIPKDSLDSLFERFYRVEESRSKETGGTGLGLAIAQSMVEMHGGKIMVESNDKKTSFIIYLPLEN
ncbi:HAMP domain-containing sensor histidine kinase [Lactobacillus sp. YT155]|uniref:sensor histidine kinase n=1 Tax=Lactobacillus sp. YT155 TaxID=3060955 RepID=UPI00265ECF75|nr:HAMP domain-containing sensor histidine kinase [Lactobacillus sp. YT155]MDO1604968.1 HAMP domain-containing sensor histidine kinase [Lactobacillus sp. YT155]